MRPSHHVLVTGSEGLIGIALTTALNQVGYAVRGLDLRARGENHSDIRDRDAVKQALDGCVGVVHLAAVSRVVDGERDPVACWQTNVEGTRNVVDAVRGGHLRRWMIYASSREVYGQPDTLPATETAPRAPVNVYGRSKVEAEKLVESSRAEACIVRFSNVYGWVGDHPDRVIPAFARQATRGLPLRVDGRDHTFDFTHLDDVVRGMLAVVQCLEEGDRLPPLHFVSGVPTTLGQLAALAVDLAGTDSPIHEAPPRSYDVSRFYGDPARAERLLRWRPRVALRDGLARLIADFRALDGASEVA